MLACAAAAHQSQSIAYAAAVDRTLLLSQCLYRVTHGFSFLQAITDQQGRNTPSRPSSSYSPGPGTPIAPRGSWGATSASQARPCSFHAACPIGQQGQPGTWVHVMERAVRVCARCTGLPKQDSGVTWASLAGLCRPWLTRSPSDIGSQQPKPCHRLHRPATQASDTGCRPLLLLQGGVPIQTEAAQPALPWLQRGRKMQPCPGWAAAPHASGKPGDSRAVWRPIGPGTRPGRRPGTPQDSREKAPRCCAHVTRCSAVCRLHWLQCRLALSSCEQSLCPACKPAAVKCLPDASVEACTLVVQGTSSIRNLASMQQQS